MMSDPDDRLAIASNACRDGASSLLYGRRYETAAMPLNFRNDDVNRLAGDAAARLRGNKTEAVRHALTNEPRRLDQAAPLPERLRPIRDRIRARPATGLGADKVFYDTLSGSP